MLVFCKDCRTFEAAKDEIWSLGRPGEYGYSGTITHNRFVEIKVPVHGRKRFLKRNTERLTQQGYILTHQ